MLTIDKITDFEKWNKFVSLSPQGTIYDTPVWCEIFDDAYKIWGVYKGEELIAGITGFEIARFFYSGNYPLNLYQGIVLKDQSYEYVVARELAMFLKDQYDMIQVINHWTITDIRPFLWADYKPLVKYTYLLEKPDLKLCDKDTRYAIKNGMELKGCTPQHFTELYTQMHKRKAITQVIHQGILEKFFNTIPCRIFGNSLACTVFIEDSKRAYYLFAASENGNTARVLWDSLIAVGREVDFVGCNNEQIGLYKRGFGGELKLCLGVQL